jgi:hypothetical protein
MKSLGLGRYTLAVAAAAAALLAGCGGSQPPIGSRAEYDGFNGVCRASEQQVSGPEHMAGTLRTVECTGAPIVPASRDYFIFIHNTAGSHVNTQDSLAVGYREYSDAPGWRFQPDVVWPSRTSLRVAMGVPSYVTTKRSEVNGINVSYARGGRDRGEGERFPMCAKRVVWCQN